MPTRQSVRRDRIGRSIANNILRPLAFHYRRRIGKGASVSRRPHAQLPGLLPRLVAFARTLIGDADRARDLVQEAAARALAARNVPADAPAYRAWTFKIVRNAALDELRAKGPRNFIDAEPDVDIWRYDDAFIARITVNQGLAAIAPAHREIIALIDIAGFNYAEAAQILGVPAGTVMSRISRARGALLEAIESSSIRPLKSSHKTNHGN
jgi:RNA polymerase sigma-70 factor (ECF subfamily)